MEEKEMNKQILCQLYEVAKKIVSRLRLNPGAYTANEINKFNKKGGLFDGFEGKDEAVNIEVGGYSCTFPLHDIFYYIATFEKLAGVASNKKQSFIIEPENNHYLSKVVVRISKKDASLSEHLNILDPRKEMRNVCLDIVNKMALATNGKSQEIKSLHIVDSSEYDKTKTRPVIDGETWNKMCKMAGKVGSELVCVLKKEVDKYGKAQGVWESVCCGVVSRVIEYRGLNYLSVLPKIDPLRKVEMSATIWGNVKKWLKSVLVTFSGGECALIIEHQKNDRFLKLEAKNEINSVITVRNVVCENLPIEAFAICFNAKTLIKALDRFCFYLPPSDTEVAIFLNSDNIQLRVPRFLPYDVAGYSLPSVVYSVSIFDLVNLEEMAIIEPCKNHQVSAHGKKAVAKPATKKTKKACKVVAMAAKKKTGKKTTAKKDRAFSFDKIGLKVGDTIQFIDGTDVTVSGNTMIEFCGEMFTLSGFARQFVPDNKKNKAGAYRGCCYFFYQGVRLDKLLKAALTKDEEEKDVQAVETVAAVEEESNEVATVQEEEKAVIIPISLHGAKWMEKFSLSSSVPSSTSMRRPGVTSSRFKFATVATVSRCLGGVAVGKGYQVAAVGTVSQGSGKVVQELPLPPPWQKVALL